MTKEVHVSQALPGAGKTEAFIKHVSEQSISEHIVLALPTNILIADVYKRLEEANVNCIWINSDSDWLRMSVKATVEQLLTQRNSIDPIVIIITHATLRAINPFLLNGFTLVIDEVPDITNSGSRVVGENTFKTFLASYVDIETVTSKTKVKEEHRELIQNASIEGMNDKAFKVAGTMYAALVDDEVTVYIKQQKNGDYQFNCVGYHNYLAHIGSADECHLLGNAVSKSLLYLHLAAKGYNFKVSKFQPEFKSYKLTPTLMPLYKGDSFSKRMLLTNTKEGGVEDKWNNQVSGEQVISNALKHNEDNGKEKILAQVHTWCEYEFDTEAIVTAFDARGLNTYSDVHRTLNLIHGNSSTIEEQLNTEMLNNMGIDLDKGKEAIKYSRCLEMIVQHICRTSIRTFDSQEVPTVHYVPNEAMARAVEEALKIKCKIDTSIMIEPPLTASKASRKEKKNLAWEMIAEGKSKKDIAEFLGVSRGTIHNWFKEDKAA